ncbi:MAG: hypothetical protein DI589_21410 [Shinella sp.]|nr:MAG: hypothetical protein DI589_21410 [Shinella sp.]
MHNITPAEKLDLTLLFAHELFIGGVPLHHLRGRKTPFWIKYEIDGVVKHHKFASVLSWRATMLFAFQAGQTIHMREMDEEGRLNRVFPAETLKRLNANALAGENPVPVLKLIDPNGPTKILITRTRLRGHAVDALHNISDGGPVFQSLWIADLLRLRSKIGIDLIPDADFSLQMPINTYRAISTKTGKIPDEAELSGADVDGNIPLLSSPPAAPSTRKVIDWYDAQKTDIEPQRKRVVYEDRQSGEITTSDKR